MGVWELGSRKTGWMRAQTFKAKGSRSSQEMQKEVCVEWQTAKISQMNHFFHQTPSLSFCVCRWKENQRLHKMASKNIFLETCKSKEHPLSTSPIRGSNWMIVVLLLLFTLLQNVHSNGFRTTAQSGGLCGSLPTQSHSGTDNNLATTQKGMKKLIVSKVRICTAKILFYYQTGLKPRPSTKPDLVWLIWKKNCYT